MTSTTKKRQGFNPLTDGLPITISVEEAMNNLATAKDRAARRSTPNTTALKPADESASPFAAVKPPTRAERDAAEFKASYAVGDTTPSKIDLRKDLPGPMLLKSTEIVRYDHNPRLYANEKRDDIRQSLLANGFQGTLQVTRRHPGEPYMLAAGSNTTLELLQELFAQTSDERYLWVNCIYQPFPGETSLLSQHLGENLNRGDMKFWEVAVGMVELMRLIEEERRLRDSAIGPLGVREASDLLAAQGLKADKSIISIWRFAVARLSALGPATIFLTARAIRDVLQPRLNLLLSLASRHGIDESVFWADVVSPTLREVASAVAREADFDASEVCDAIERRLADRTDDSLETVRQMLTILKLNPKAQLADLRQPSPNLIAAPSSPSHSNVEQTPPTPAPSGQRPLNLTAALNSVPSSSPSSSPSPSPSPKTTQQGNIGTPGPAASNTNEKAAPRTSVGPLFDHGQSDAVDPLGALHSAIDELLATAGLTDTLRWCDSMPLGFYLELPDRELHKRKKVQIDSPEDQARTIKTSVWWSLTTVSGQWFEGVVDCIDHNSAFYRTYSVENHDSPLDGTDIEPVRPEVEELLLTRVSPGLIRTAMAQLRTVEDLAAVVMEKLPERWKLMQKLQRSSSPY